MIRCGVELNTLEVDVGRVSNDVVLIFDDENESIFGFRPRNQIDFIPDLYVDFSGFTTLNNYVSIAAGGIENQNNSFIFF